MATHSSMLAWEVPWTEEPGRLQSMGSQESDVTKHARQATGRNTHGVSNKYAYPIQPSFNPILEVGNWRPRKVNSPRIQQVVCKWQSLDPNPEPVLSLCCTDGG